jgi:hypothetical protein
VANPENNLRNFDKSPQISLTKQWKHAIERCRRRFLCQVCERDLSYQINSESSSTRADLTEIREAGVRRSESLRASEPESEEARTQVLDDDERAYVAGTESFRARESNRCNESRIGGCCYFARANLKKGRQECCRAREAGWESVMRETARPI